MQEQMDKILNFLERLMRTDIRYALRGYFWYTIEYFFAGLSGIATSVAFANLLLPQTYGTFKFVLSFFPFLTLTTLRRLDDSLTISVARGFEGDTFRIFKTKIKWGLFGCVIGLGISIYYLFSGNNILAILAAIAAFFVPIFDTPYVYASFLIGKKNFKLLSILNSLNSVVYAAIIIFTIWLSKNIFVILLVYFAINTLVRLAALLYILKIYRPNIQTEQKTISYGKKISFLEIITVGASYIDNILVFHYLGALELAAYTFIKKFPEQLKDLMTFLRPLAMPKLATKDIDEPFIKKEILRKSLFLALFMLLISLAYVALAPLIFKFLFNPYTNFMHLSQLYAITLPLGVLGMLFLNALEATRKVRTLVKLNILTAICKVAILLISIKFYGLPGLVISFLLIRIVTSVLNIYFFYRHSEPSS